MNDLEASLSRDLLSIGTDPVKPNLNVWVPFLDQVGRLGYVEGRNIAIERMG